MRRSLLILVSSLIFASSLTAQPAKSPADLRSVLLAELHSTHDKSEWFVCGNIALANLTPEQANWTDGKGNHSVGQLAYHLVYWNERTLTDMRGEKKAAFNGNNDETFTTFDAKRWSDTVSRFDQVMQAMEQLVATAPEEKLKEWAPSIANTSTHNAYHIGQIVFVRKEHGVWDASKGVK